MSVREMLNVELPSPMTQTQVDAMMEAAGFRLVAPFEGAPPDFLALEHDPEEWVRCRRPLVFFDSRVGEYVIQTQSLNRGQVPASLLAFFEKAFEGCGFSWSRDYQEPPIAEGILGATALPESRF